MCCLKYEHPLYAEFAREVPAVGERVALPDGDAVVVAHQVPADTVVVRMASSGNVMSCSRASVCGARQTYEERESADSERTPPRHRPRLRRRRTENQDPAD
jgi:cell fate regulator YaaT (PSP1 superfamily)